MQTKIESKLLAAYQRCCREGKPPFSGCTTVVGHIRLGGKKYQIQVHVTSFKEDWRDEKLAGINPPNGQKLRRGHCEPASETQKTL